MLTQTNSLQLVYPPISNQEGEWLAQIPEVRALASRSKLYMIGQRAELFFRDLRLDESSETLFFDIVQADHEIGMSLTMPIASVIPDYKGVIEIELGDKLIRIWHDPHRSDEEPLAWFTPDKLLFDLSHDHVPGKAGIDVRRLTHFDLLYVGISKAGDSLSRLFDTGHHARLSILSNERQRFPTSRVSDEMTLFMFDIERMGIGIYDYNQLPEVVGVDFRADPGRVVADAEKALVKTLSPRYNEVRYVNYPRGTDGLYGTALTWYSYAIREDVTFHTGSGTIRGGVQENDYDVITIDGDDVTVAKFDQDEP